MIGIFFNANKAMAEAGIIAKTQRIRRVIAASLLLPRTAYTNLVPAIKTRWKTVCVQTL